MDHLGTPDLSFIHLRLYQKPNDTQGENQNQIKESVILKICFKSMLISNTIYICMYRSFFFIDFFMCRIFVCQRKKHIKLRMQRHEVLVLILIFMLQNIIQFLFYNSFVYIVIYIIIDIGIKLFFFISYHCLTFVS